MNNNRLATIDKDALDFLYALYFGTFNDALDAATNRAYRDMNRTIRFCGLADEKRKEIRLDVNGLIRVSVQELRQKSKMDQKFFDDWHKKLCDAIIEMYEKNGITFTYGQAQKWINMTLKYLYVIEPNLVEPLFKYCHVPLDNYVFDISERLFSIEKPKIPWSRWCDYYDQYMAYQMQLRSSIKNEEPLRWEFRAWLQEARGVQEGM